MENENGKKSLEELKEEILLLKSILEEERKNIDYKHKKFKDETISSDKERNLRSNKKNNSGISNPALIVSLFSFGMALIYAGTRKISVVELVAQNWLALLGALIAFIAFYRYMDVILKSMRKRLDFIDVDEKFNNKSSKPVVAKKSEEVDKEDVAEKFKDNILVPPEDALECFVRIIQSLQIKADRADAKASLLLSRGIRYTIFGIVFYLFSIVSWQYVFWHHGYKVEYLWGILSCSFLFIFVEFLSAWFLRQYKSFTDNSVYLIKVKSIFDRYLLMYLVEGENSFNQNGNVFKKVLDSLALEITWPDTNVIESKDKGFSAEALTSLTELLTALKKDSPERNP